MFGMIAKTIRLSFMNQAKNTKINLISKKVFLNVIMSLVTSLLLYYWWNVLLVLDLQVKPLSLSSIFIPVMVVTSAVARIKEYLNSLLIMQQLTWQDNGTIIQLLNAIYQKENNKSDNTQKDHADIDKN